MVACVVQATSSLGRGLTKSRVEQRNPLELALVRMCLDYCVTVILFVWRGLTGLTGNLPLIGEYDNQLPTA